MADLVTLFATSQFQTVMILIAVDVILGVIAALLKKEFVLGKLAGFVKGPVVGYVFGLAVLTMVGQALPALAMMVTIAYWLVVLALLGSILDNLGKLGLPIPKILRK
jgi:phage-related holin